ncbi:hypothetical protein AB0E04_27100 [Streptomyces sp. NPDC048251]|uniref:hypothetical protein n=1 Tax=Streptomyces sp. NPDC048251 TaxID=3154501 RepID=UPI003419D8E8
MKLRVGQSLCSAVDGTTVIVVRCPEQDVTVTCGGVEMYPQGEAPTSSPATPTGAVGDGVLLGKRYTAEEGALEVLCVRPGKYPVAANGAALSLKAAQPLPASD